MVSTTSHLKQITCPSQVNKIKDARKKKKKKNENSVEIKSTNLKYTNETKRKKLQNKINDKDRNGVKKNLNNKINEKCFINNVIYKSMLNCKKDYMSRGQKKKYSYKTSLSEGKKKNMNTTKSVNSHQIKNENYKIQENKCILKKLNGEIKELNLNNIHEILPNYIPYQQSIQDKYDIFKNKITCSYSYTSTQTMDKRKCSKLGFIQKCTKVFKMKKDENKMHTCTNVCQKIKLPINNNLNDIQALDDEDELCAFEKNLTKKEAVQRKNLLLYQSSYIKHNKNANFQNINSVKENVSPIVLKHSRNMILSKKKNLKFKHMSSIPIVEDTQKKQNIYQTNNHIDITTIKNTDKKNKIYDDKKEKSIFQQNVNNKQSNNFLEISSFDEKNSNIKLEQHNHKNKCNIKDTCVKKKMNYKVIYQSDEDKNKKTPNECIDTSSLLCKPGYVEKYLYESNSSISCSPNNDKNRNAINNNNNFKKLNERTNIIQNSESHDYIEKNNINIYKYDDILYYMKKAIYNSPTYNIDIQYMSILNEILQVEKLKI
ncbi:conserved Plasmodium protein, unknown function [Plasmodium sp. gorilla clade G2]|uniref:conserved Plasmodium protein, unknown function n=1 Tax=Plasmodium sp. gorilla clade G2 TaxID=880535 RepID=UPI000D20906B|nr:conserved Plasmodium protein, unknown function [Plasmodium sp. gorilla clade G2]SOV16112.1 conserved Plasmodium protein, unknown function [Plasmodium sp. gorilla clade G2]